MYDEHTYNTVIAIIIIVKRYYYQYRNSAFIQQCFFLTKLSICCYLMLVAAESLAVGEMKIDAKDERGSLFLNKAARFLFIRDYYIEC